MIRESPDGTLRRARQLRKELTPHERRLWAHLRAKRFQAFKFRRQHPVDPYILDFYCPERRLAVELDGSQHAEEAQCAHDAERTRFLEQQGIRVLRFWNREFTEGENGVLEAILTALLEEKE
jgi:very-short-patch-repair endonuclease